MADQDQLAALVVQVDPRPLVQLPHPPQELVGGELFLDQVEQRQALLAEGAEDVFQSLGQAELDRPAVLQRLVAVGADVGPHPRHLFPGLRPRQQVLVDVLDEGDLGVVRHPGLEIDHDLGRALGLLRHGQSHALALRRLEIGGVFPQFVLLEPIRVAQPNYQ